MRDTSTCDVAFDKYPPLPLVNPPCSKLKIRANDDDDEEDADDLSLEKSSNKEEEEMELEGSTDEYDFRAKDISEGGDDMTF